MRVYELAKELGKTNKELLSIVSEKDASIKSHSSSLTDELVAYIRTKVSGKKSMSEKATASNEKKEGMQTIEEKSAKQSAPEEKKEGKKKLTAVFRPQNAQHASKNRAAVQRQTEGRYVPVQKNTGVKPAVSSSQHTEQKSVPKPTHSTKPDETHAASAAEEKKISSLSNGKTEQNPANSAVSSENVHDFNKTSESGEKKQEIKTDATSLSKPKSVIEGKVVDNTSTPRVNVYDNLKLQKAEPIKPVRNIFENNPQARSDANQRGQNRQSQSRFQDRGQRNGEGNRNQPRGEHRQQGDRNFNRQGGENRNQGFQRGGDNRNQGGQRSSENRDFNRNQGGNRSFADNRNQGGNRTQSGNRNFTDRGFADKSGHKGFQDGGYDKDKDAAPRTFQKQKPSSKPVMDSPLAKKTSASRLNKNQFKNQKDEKKNRTEDGPVKGAKVTKHPFIMPVKKEEAKVEDIKEIVIPALITIKDLASQLKLNASSIVKKLFLKGEICTINTEIPFEKAEEIALEYDVICTMEEVVDEVQVLTEDVEDAPETLKPRPPVVCVVGHIDHGKTSLLDAIRKTSVTAREAGGITQHIGAYMVEINGQMLTFLDTPGHEAFTSMRMRGAQSTDFAVLVVAADDGVMPQTVEAINHAKAAGIEIIVAINKIDKQGINLDRVRQELAEHELISEDWGGSTVFCEVSAKTRVGIENLLEMILLTAEMKELKANPDRMARGVVIEAKLDKGKGPVATVLVQKGTLKDGDFVSAGSSFGKVRAMMDHNGKRVKKAAPSTPVEIQGLDSVPNAGDILMVGESLANVKNNAEVFKNASKDKLIEETKAKLSLNDLFSKIKEGELKELPIIIKGDVQGSVEALKQSLLKLSNDEVTVRIVHSGVGAISESDVSLAAASNTIIIGYGVRIDPTAAARANEENVDVKLYKIIYDAINDVESAMKGMLAPVYEEKIIGTAEIRKVYKASGIGSIAGSYITSGKFQRGCKVRISRGSELIFEGNLAGLKRFQDDVKEVASGYECGLSFEKFNDIAEMDTIEAYIMVEVPRK